MESKRRSGAKTIKKNTNSTQNKYQTHRAKQYEVTSFLSTDCELSTETCSKNVYSLGPWFFFQNALYPMYKAIRKCICHQTAPSANPLSRQTAPYPPANHGTPNGGVNKAVFGAGVFSLSLDIWYKMNSFDEIEEPVIISGWKEASTNTRKS